MALRVSCNAFGDALLSLDNLMLKNVSWRFMPLAISIHAKPKSSTDCSSEATKAKLTSVKWWKLTVSIFVSNGT